MAAPSRTSSGTKRAKNGASAAPRTSGASGGKPGSRWASLRLLLEVAAIFLVVNRLFIAGYRIPSASMETTLMTGDFLFVTPLPYGPHIPFSPWNLPGFMDPKRGTISVYQSPPQYWDPANPGFAPIVVKRIVAVPGDTIFMRAGVFFVNGMEQRLAQTPPPGPTPPGDAHPAFVWQRKFEVLNSRFGPPPAQLTHDDWGPMLVPAERYFSLGDNRYNSIDARYYGFIPRRNFRGRPLFIYFSVDLDDWRIRWERLGKILWRA